MPLSNVVGTYDGVTFPFGTTNQSTASALDIGAALESYANTSSYTFDAPARNGYLGWTLDSLYASGSFTYGATNTNYLMRVYVPANGTSTKADVNVTTAGTVTNVVAGLYTNAGVQLTTAADIHSSWTTGKNTFTWAASQNLQGGTFYILALIIAQSVAPVLSGSATSPVQNFNLTAANSIFATNGTASALPATYTLASNTAVNTQMPWVAVY